jgi:hypothetical protein
MVFVAENFSVREPHPSAAVGRAVQVDRGADQGEVGEGLREVAESLPGHADLLGIQPEVAGVGEHVLEDRPGFLHPPARVSAST